ncbi:hypothetical protein ACFEY4_004022 [Enterobacter asburiae]|jgi:hypothetical protein
MGNFMANCLSINNAVNLAVSSGNSVQSIIKTWTKIERVVYMAKELTENVRVLIEASEPSLRYWHTERTPHNPPEEGFICDKHKIAITFPR